MQHPSAAARPGPAGRRRNEKSLGAGTEAQRSRRRVLAARMPAGYVGYSWWVSGERGEAACRRKPCRRAGAWLDSGGECVRKRTFPFVPAVGRLDDVMSGGARNAPAHRPTPLMHPAPHSASKPMFTPPRRGIPEWLSARSPQVASRRAGTRSPAAGIRSTVRTIYIREWIAASRIDRYRAIPAERTRLGTFAPAEPVMAQGAAEPPKRPSARADHRGRRRDTVVAPRKRGTPQGSPLGSTRSVDHGIGGRYKDRTCDPYHVKVVLYR